MLVLQELLKNRQERSCSVARSTTVERRARIVLWEVLGLPDDIPQTSEVVMG